MLFIVEPQSKSAANVSPATFEDLSFRERFDLQEWVLACPQLLGDDLLIVTCEFDSFDRTSERLDILAVDRQGKLVVVELKRTAVGSKADLQALRYAAYCSTLGLDDVADIYASFVQQRNNLSDFDAEAGRQQIASFIDDPEFIEFGDKPRIILAAEEFPPEMTATLLWLRTYDLDISAVRLRPYKVGEKLLVDCAVLIPLPEAKDFIIRRERKDIRQSANLQGRGGLYRAWFQILLDELREVHQFTNARVAQAQNWFSFASGYSGITYNISFSQQGLRAEVYIDRGEQVANKSLFDALHDRREKIEHDYAQSMNWERLDNRQASRVAIYNGTTINAMPDELVDARSWAVQQLLQLRQVFEPHLRELVH